MSSSRRGATASRATALAVVAFACGAGSAFAGDAGPNARSLPGLAPGAATDIETVLFADPQRAPVRLVRGPRQPPTSARAADIPLRQATPPTPASAPLVHPIRKEMVSFGTGRANAVTVLRGPAAIPVSLPGRPGPGAQSRTETVTFADPLLPPVTVLRGPSIHNWFAVDLFGPPNAGVLDRIAFAVDGVESRHGADLRMWRPEPNGPQGPMQVSLAAALDVGGGDRFDIQQNRMLGRAYLAQMFQRYGNWPDAVAAYNWGPGSMDQWITGGRRAEKLPFDVARYVDLVMRHALITSDARSR